MDLFTITAIDMHSSDTMSRTFSTDSVIQFKDSVIEFEDDLPYRRYELVTDEFVDDYPKEIIEVLDDHEVTY